MASEIDTAQQRAHFIDTMYNFALYGIDEGEEAKVRSEIGVYFDRFSKQTRRDALAEAAQICRQDDCFYAASEIDRLREGVK